MAFVDTMTRRNWDQYRLATGADCTYGVHRQLLRLLGRDPYQQQFSSMPFPALREGGGGTNDDEYRKIFDWCSGLYRTVSPQYSHEEEEEGMKEKEGELCQVSVHDR